MTRKVAIKIGVYFSHCRNSIARRLKSRPALYAILVWFSFSWSWMFFTDLLDLAGSKKQGLVLAILIFIMNIAIATTVMWSAVRIMAYSQRTFPKYVVLLVALPFFAFADFAVSWLTTIVWIGPQGLADSVLPLGSMALPIMNTPFAYASRFLGFYGMAGVLWYILWLVFHKQYRRYAFVVLVLLSILSGISWQMFKNVNGEKLQVLLVSETLMQRLPSIDARDSDLVVFPEYGLDKIATDNLHERVKRTKEDEHATYFVGSEQIFSNEFVGHINNMLFGDTTAGITHKQYKYRLIPAGEDLPYIIRLGLRATGQRSTLDYFSYAKGVIRGRGQLKPFVISEEVKIAAAVCSSIIAPQDYRDFARAGATLFTNSASLGIFQGSYVFAWQQKTLARFMAIANARYFVQSSNGFSAYAVDHNGRTYAEASGLASLSTVAQSNSRKTFYTYVGEWLTVFGGVCCAVIFLQNIRTAYRSYHKKSGI